MIRPIVKRITTSATTNALATSCVLHQAIISCSAGTEWTLAIQDKAVVAGVPTPNIWIPAFTLSIPVDGYPNVIGKFELPLPMEGGIDIVTAGGTGVVCVCLIIGQ